MRCLCVDVFLQSTTFMYAILGTYLLTQLWTRDIYQLHNNHPLLLQLLSLWHFDFPLMWICGKRNISTKGDNYTMYTLIHFINLVWGMYWDNICQVLTAKTEGQYNVSPASEVNWKFISIDTVYKLSKVHVHYQTASHLRQLYFQLL